jgi:hypothetical protein
MYTCSRGPTAMAGSQQSVDEGSMSAEFGADRPETDVGVCVVAAMATVITAMSLAITD